MAARKKETRTFNSAAEAGRLLYDGAQTEKPYPHASIAGFQVVVTRPDSQGNFTRYYRVRYDELDAAGNRRDRKVPLGSVGELDYSKARALATEHLERARVARQTGKPALPTLKQAFDDYMVFKTTIVAKEKQLRAATVKDYRDRFADFIPPDWYSTPIDELTPERWSLLRRDCTTEASLAARGRAPVSESRFDIMLKGAISGLYSRQQANHQGLQNPVQILRKTGVVSRNKEKHDYLATEVLPAVWQYIDSEIRRPQRDIILVGLLTGWRLQLMTKIPLDRIKKAKRAVEWRTTDVGGPYAEADGDSFDYPVSDLLWEEVFEPRLARVRPGQKFLIESGRRPGMPFKDVRDSLAKVDDLAGCHVSAHVLRKTFGTLAPTAGVPQRIISHLMMHKTSGSIGSSAMTASYQKRDFESMKTGANQYATWFATTVGMRTSSAPAPAPAAQLNGMSEEFIKQLVALKEAGISEEFMSQLFALKAVLK